MTSNNTIVYHIYDKNNNQVGTHTQNIMCKRNNDGLEKYKPYDDYTIEYFDEDDYEESEPIKLSEWLLKNKAEFTFKPFDKDDVVKAIILIEGKKKKVDVKIIERFKGKWNPYYTAETESGEIIEELQQYNIIPL